MITLSLYTTHLRRNYQFPRQRALQFTAGLTSSKETEKKLQIPSITVVIKIDLGLQKNRRILPLILFFRDMVSDNKPFSAKNKRAL